jgi:CO/xanthine dehydrogenase FAD-binding subunit
MVELNFDRRRPERILDLNRVRELEEIERDDGALVIGAGVSFARVVADLPAVAPGLAIASRTVGSPQIRNRGTLGGNLGTASPAGDALPPLVAADAEVELASVRGRRRMPVAEFCLGPKRNALEPDELIAAVRLRLARGPEQFAKIGPRNAMVIAVCSFSLALDLERREVGTAIGSAAPRVVRAGEAERFLAETLEEDGRWESGGPLREPELARFGELVGAASRPIDDVRGSAEYRRHALAVLGRRALAWAWEERRGGRP